jgi:hypothetical protein
MGLPLQLWELILVLVAAQGDQSSLEEEVLEKYLDEPIQIQIKLTKIS